MRARIHRIMWNPWVYRISCLIIFTVIMLAFRWLIHRIADQGHATLFAFAAVFFPCLFTFSWWWDRRSY